MPSEEQVAANRENSRLSTGPRTAAGKMKSSMNSLKHGGYSKRLLLSDEQAADLRRLERMYQAHYRPRNEFEIDQVQALTALAWRLRRYGRMETEILQMHGFEKVIGQSVGEVHFEGPGFALTHDCTKSKSLLGLCRVEASMFRRFSALKKELDVNRALRARAGEPSMAEGGGSPPVNPSPVA